MSLSLKACRASDTARPDRQAHDHHWHRDVRHRCRRPRVAVRPRPRRLRSRREDEASADGNHPRGQGDFCKVQCWMSQSGRETLPHAHFMSHVFWVRRDAHPFAPLNDNTNRKQRDLWPHFYQLNFFTQAYHGNSEQHRNEASTNGLGHIDALVRLSLHRPVLRRHVPRGRRLDLYGGHGHKHRHILQEVVRSRQKDSWTSARKDRIFGEWVVVST